MAIVCFIIVVVIRKKGKIQNDISSNTQQIELQTTRSTETTQRTNQTGPSRPLSSTILDTIDSTHYPAANRRSLPPYNESSNTPGPYETPTVVSYPYLSLQQPPAPYQQQAGHHQQPPSLNLLQPSAPPYPYEAHSYNTFNVNESNQSSTTAAPTSFPTYPAQNPIVQASGQQESNVHNWKAPSDVQATLDNPSAKFLDAAHGESEYETMEVTYEEVKF